jgi:hypothetical protein
MAKRVEISYPHAVTNFHTSIASASSAIGQNHAALMAALLFGLLCAGCQRHAPQTESTQATGPNHALFSYLGDPVTPPADLDADYTKDGLTRAMQNAARDAGIFLDEAQH